MRRAALERWRPAPGEWDRAAATHLLRRAGLGPAPGEVERALDEGFEASVERVLGDDAHDPRLREGVRALLAAGDEGTLRAWWTALLLDGRAALSERMALVWHDHFATSIAKVGDVRLMHAQNETLRELGLRDFRALVHALAVDPAMLVWLDGDQNRRGHPNENFARELMELFCLGLGSYGERDVQEAARAFTGWGTEGRRFAYDAAHHDGGEKELFGRRGRLGGDEAVDLVLAHEACPRHVARRLWRELVHPEPTEDEVEALARVLVERDWDVRATVAVVLRSEAFFAPRARRARIAGPVELLVASVRALGARVAPAVVARAAEEAGQALFRPPSVEGWDGGPAWIRSSSWIARHNALVALARAHVEETDGVEVDLRPAFGDPRRPEDVPGAVVAHLLPDGLAPASRAALDDAARAADGLDEALATVTALVLTSPEHHLF